MPSIVPTVEPNIKNRNWVLTTDKAFDPAASIRCPVNGCWTMFDIRDTMTMTLNNDSADAINPTLAPESRVAYASVSIECINSRKQKINSTCEVITCNV